MGLAQKQSGQERDELTPLVVNEVNELMKTVPQWTLHDRSIVREISFDGFRQAIDFVNRVARAAEEKDHHPDIFISYNKVRLDLWTHKAGGLTRNDFELAAQVDQLI